MKYSDDIVQQDLKLIIDQKVNWDKLAGSTVLITGATGMLATYMGYTIEYLNSELKLNVKAILTYRNEDKLSMKYQCLFESQYLKFVQSDVTQSLEINDDIDWIIHAASNASPKYIMSDPVGIIEANVLGTRNLLHLAKKKSIKGFHFLSTREVYGQAVNGVTSVSEQDYGVLDILEKRSCYPESKRMAETLIKSFSAQYGVPFTISRIAHSYGPGMEISNDGRIMSDLIYNVVNNEDIVLKSEGKAERAFCYIADTIAAIFMIMLNGENGEAYNVANEDEPITIAKLAMKMTQLFPTKKLKVVFKIPEKTQEGYAKFERTTLSTLKIERLGWKKCVDLDKGIEKTVMSFDK